MDGSVWYRKVYDKIFLRLGRVCVFGLVLKGLRCGV